MTGCCGGRHSQVSARIETGDDDFSINVTRVDEAAGKLDGIAGTIRALRLSTSMATLGTAIPDTPNVVSPVKPVADTADATVSSAVDRCAGQVEAFGALVRVAARTTAETDEFNASRFTGAGDLPSVTAWDPFNQMRPAPATG